jgi:hypothetical protein
VVLQNKIFCRSVLEFPTSNIALFFFYSGNTNWCNRYQSNAENVFGSTFSALSSAAVAYQLSITHIHSSHHRFIVDDYFGLLDVLVSNPSLDQFSAMSGTRKTNIFLVFPLHGHQFVIVYCNIFSFNFAFFILWATPFLMWHNGPIASVSLSESLLCRWGLEYQLSMVTRYPWLRMGGGGISSNTTFEPWGSFPRDLSKALSCPT